MMEDSDKYLQVTTIAIGDLHFHDKNLQEAKEFVERVVPLIKKYSPTFVVILGDTLHTHSKVDVPPHNLACDFIELISEICHVYLLIGNHDLINHCQFLTTNHIFGPLKKWKNVTVVDRPVFDTYGDYSFVFCPYVPPGRFMEALDTVVKDGETWDLCDCIFSHQEYYGCQQNTNIFSEKGDRWNDDYPPIISGHIHTCQKINSNIFYPGSSLPSYGEPTKKMWFVKFGDIDEPPYFSIEKINVGMKGKKILHINIEEADSIDEKLLEKHHLKIALKGTSEQFEVFRRGKLYSNLLQKGVKFSHKRIDTELKSEKVPRDVSFLSILKKIVQERSGPVEEVYNDLLNSKEEVVYELIFESSDESEEEM